MCGWEMTSGLSLKRSSASASGTTKTSDCKIAVEQKAMSREVAEALILTRDMNHWRFSANREIRALGGVHGKQARSERTAKDSSGSGTRRGGVTSGTKRAS